MKKDRVEREESDREPASKPPQGDDAEKAGEAKKPAPFVFRFLPADPKNALDFEDMADK